MTNNNLYEELQSSYRKFHSTETALTCVHDDILRAIDDNKSISLIMLDLSAARDTVDHDVLPIESRSKFKILLLVYECLYGLAPSYLSKRLSLKPNRGLRSDDKLVLNVPTTKLKTKTYGDRCFSIAGPNLWNQLPSHIRFSKSIDVFKRSLKTHLFKDAFN